MVTIDEKDLLHKITALEIQAAVMQKEMEKDTLNHSLALAIQTKEIERRLEGLNGEAGRLKDMQVTFIPRETYELNHKMLEDKIETIQRIVYIGIGGVLVLELFLKFFLK